jgi:hypothetical protein
MQQAPSFVLRYRQSPLRTKAAVPELISALRHVDTLVREVASRLLKRFDPEAAKKAGTETEKEHPSREQRSNRDKAGRGGQTERSRFWL